MTNKTQHEQNYLNNQVVDCPWCGTDRPNHSCTNCHKDMSQENCWKWQGYCSEKCFKYVAEELPRLRQEKIDAGIKCQCDNPSCAKCLSSNCQNENCPTHTKKRKAAWRKRNSNQIKDSK